MSNNEAGPAVVEPENTSSSGVILYGPSSVTYYNLGDRKILLVGDIHSDRTVDYRYKGDRQYITHQGFFIEDSPDRYFNRKIYEIIREINEENKKQEPSTRVLKGYEFTINENNVNEMLEKNVESPKSLFIDEYIYYLSKYGVDGDEKCIDFFTEHKTGIGIASESREYLSLTSAL